MEPLSPEKEKELLTSVIARLKPLGFTMISKWMFLKNGNIYDLSAADLDQIERIEREGLFILDHEGVACTKCGQS